MNPVVRRRIGHLVVDRDIVLSVMGLEAKGRRVWTIRSVHSEFEQILWVPHTIRIMEEPEGIVIIQLRRAKSSYTRFLLAFTSPRLCIL